MKVGRKFFPVPYEGYNARDVRMLRRIQGGVIAYGRWHVLLGMLYQSGGRFELDEMTVADLRDELEMTEEEVMRFLEDCAKVGMLSAEFLGRGVVASEGVCDQLHYIAQQREYGKKRAKATPKG